MVGAVGGAVSLDTKKIKLFIDDFCLHLFMLSTRKNCFPRPLGAESEGTLPCVHEGRVMRFNAGTGKIRHR